MSLSPLLVVVAVAFVISVGLLLIVALEEKFDETTAAEFKHDVAYHTMLMELHEMQVPAQPKRRARIRPLGVTPLYESTSYGS